MKLNFNGILYALSFALDEVENELVSINKGHGNRVALISVLIGKELGLNEDELYDLAGLAILHDNALTEYFYEERNTKNNLSLHCSIGEENLKNIPFKTNIKNAILYHHEKYNGKGIFKKKPDEVCMYAKLIHFGDSLDGYLTDYKGNISYASMVSILNKYKEIDYSSILVNTCLKVIDEDYFNRISHEKTIDLLNEIIPPKNEEFTFEEIKNIVNLFAKIVDYKSEYTKNHSLGIAMKAYEMAHYYNYDEITAQKLYMAGAFHDIGKMTINNIILEKTSKLSDDEFYKMKNHVMMTNYILKHIPSFEDITKWASNHHEKLNGNGYPLNKKDIDLDDKDRLLAVLDIFQALNEKRSYKKKFTDIEIVSIMNKMVDNYEIDKKITTDVLNIYLKKHYKK